MLNILGPLIALKVNNVEKEYYSTFSETHCMVQGYQCTFRGSLIQTIELLDNSYAGNSRLMSFT